MEWREYFMIEGLSFFMIQVLFFDIHSLTPASDKVIKKSEISISRIHTHDLNFCSLSSV